MNKIRRKTVTLSVTERCNLNCIYCYQKEGRNKRATPMTLDVATSVVQHHLSAEDNFEEVVFDLFGGEPLLAWPMIRDLVKWADERRAEWKKRYLFFIDTNGTLLTPEIKAWVAERRHHVIMGLSLDGSPEAHDLNRSNSYAQIKEHLSFFAETWPDQPIKMTISPQTVPMIFEGIVHIMRQGLLVSANVPMEDIWGSPAEKAQVVDEFRRQIELLVDLFGQHLELPPPRLIDLAIGVVNLVQYQDRPWCGAGRAMMAHTSKGDTFPCSRYFSMSFDQVLFDQSLSPEQSRCRFCNFRAACQSCEANNWEATGNPNDRTTFHCEFTKLQIWGTAQIWVKRAAARLESIPEYWSDTPERDSWVEKARTAQQELSAATQILEDFEKHGDLLDVGMQKGWRDAVWEPGTVSRPDYPLAEAAHLCLGQA
ncbi:MAG: radical SAM protein [Thermodesulfobacteriota bacterium]